jgi:hypothetical protein
MGCVVGPVDDFHPAIGILNQGRAAFDPITVIAVQNAINFPHFCMVDVTADHAIDTALFGLMGNGFFKFADEFDGVFDLLFQKR